MAPADVKPAILGQPVPETGPALTLDWQPPVLDLLATVPWGQNLLILKKLADPAARLYYLRATAQFGWSRNVLMNQIKAKAYERAVTEKKTHNFPLALPEYLAEQAEEAMKSSYNLEFLDIHREVKERELEARLIERLRDFLLELGYGFCFVGRQHCPAREGRKGVMSTREKARQFAEIGDGGGEDVGAVGEMMLYLMPNDAS